MVPLTSKMITLDYMLMRLCDANIKLQPLPKFIYCKFLKTEVIFFWLLLEING